MENKWKNFGDVNFLEYGGCLVRKSPDIEGHYEVFRLMTEIADADEGTKAAFLYVVDFDDVDEDTLKDVLRLCGLEDSENVVGKTREEIIAALTPELVTKECVEAGEGFFSQVTYCSDYPMGIKDAFISDEDLVEWLRYLGAEEYVS